MPTKILWNNLREVGVGRKNKEDLDNLDPDQLNNDFAKFHSTPTTLPLFPCLDYSEITVNTLHSFEFSCVEQTDVVKAILNVKSKAVGFDEIHPSFVKIILPHLLPALTHVFNNIILTSSFPSLWKSSKIIPILKKQGSRISPPEYRPISILPFLSKVMEKLIHFQVSAFLQNNKLLYRNQSGFRPKHSCISALLKVTDDIRMAIDKDEVTFLTLLDFSKAFDMVNHSQLIQKLERIYRFSPAAAKLIATYLAERKQAVVLKNKVSKFVNVSTGVPQGSILGPLLFSIFINDLPLSVKNSAIHMYADDVQIYLSCKLGLIEDGAHRLNEDLKQVSLWAERNSLKLNPLKSKCLVINKNKLDTDYFPKVYLGTSEIEYIDKAKNLGIWFNRTLSWDDHIQSVIGKVYGCLRNLSLSQHFTPQNTRLMLAKTLILPHITYGFQIFCSPSAVMKRKLLVVFNNLIRYVFLLRRYDHVSPFRNKILGCTLEAYLDYLVIIYLHKIIISKQPPYLHEKIHFFRSSRSPSILQPDFSCLTTERQFFTHAVRLWNALPLSIRRLHNNDRFDEYLFLYLANR